MILWKRWGILPFFIAVMLWAVPVTAEETGHAGGVNADAAGGLPHWYLGITAGYTNNGLYVGGDNRAFSQYERGHGFEISIPGRYQFTNWFALQAELQFIQKNYSWVRDKNFDGIYMDVTNSFIDFPVMAHFSFGGSRLRGFLNTGAFLGVWVNSHHRGKTIEGTSNVWDLDNTATYYDDYDENVEFVDQRDSRFDAGLLLGLGIQYEWKPVTIFVEGRYNYGLTDLQKKYMYEQLPRINDTFTITIGAIFNHNFFDIFRR
jgi:hypothetical protein